MPFRSSGTGRHERRPGVQRPRDRDPRRNGVTCPTIAAALQALGGGNDSVGVMSVQERTVSSRTELLEATSSPEVSRICVARTLTELPGTRLLPGQALMATDENVALGSASGEDGVELSSNNVVQDLELRVDPNRRALYNDTTVKRLGVLALRNLRVTGLLQLLAKGSVQSGHVEATRVEIAAADARCVEPRTSGYGVDVVVGAFTVWNQSVEATTLTADITVSASGVPINRSRALASL